MLSDFHCKRLGLEGEPGEKVSFTFLDGTTEEFTISGIYHVDGSPKLLSIILSQKYGEQGSQLKDVTYQGTQVSVYLLNEPAVSLKSDQI